ncbi:MAG: hypothetical protein SGILL_004534, partial [Bacillariaceae sp.]
MNRCRSLSFLFVATTTALCCCCILNSASLASAAAFAPGDSVYRKKISSSSSSSSSSTTTLPLSLTRNSSKSNSNSNNNSISALKMSSNAAAANLAPGATDLFQQTPLIKSAPLSKLVGKDVYLKLDALQASGSFKDRGMAHLCATFHEKNVKELISSSGGNAGLAVATVGSKLGMTVKVIVPETTKAMVVEKLQSLGAHVTIHGVNWNAADTLARTQVEDENGRAEYVSPYDSPLLWTGHSSIVDEVVEQLPTTGSSSKIGAMIVSVGGGGLLCGVLEGCERQSLQCKVIASETEGASSFGQAWKAGKVVTLPGIDSIATSLGATSVTPVALERAKNHKGKFDSAICTDAEAVDACVQFAQDHRILVEPA